MTHTFSSTIVRVTKSLKDKSLISPCTQSSGSGNGSITIVMSSIPGPDDDEARAAVLEVETFLLRQRINHQLNVTDHRNVTSPRTPLLEQRAYATLANFSAEGGAL